LVRGEGRPRERVMLRWAPESNPNSVVGIPTGGGLQPGNCGTDAVSQCTGGVNLTGMFVAAALALLNDA
jgi:hypothetical protein